MALLDLYAAKFDPESPYMTEGERVTFRRLRDGNALSFFRVTVCVCGKEIPKPKKFCSKDCYESNQLAEKIVAAAADFARRKG